MNNTEQQLNLLNLVSDPIAYIDKNLRHQFVNAAYANWIGIDSDVIAGKTVSEVLGTDIFLRIKPHIDLVLSGHQSWFENTIPDSHGLRFADICLNPDFGEKGVVIGYSMHITGQKKTSFPNYLDAVIKEQEQTKLALKESEDRYRNLLELLPVAVYTCDAQGYIQLYNQAAVNLWGRQPEIGKDMWCGSWKIFDPATGAPIELDTCPMAITLKEGRPVVGQEIIIERPDGVRRNILPYPRPIFDISGKITGAINMLTDITDEKRAGQVLRESDERFRLIADLVPIIIWMSDRDGNITYLNRQWTELTGKSTKDSYGHNWLDLLHQQDRARAYRKFIGANTEPGTYRDKFRCLNTNGRFTILELNAIPRFNEEEKFIGYVGILQNVDKQEKLTSSLERQVRERTEDLTKNYQALTKSEERYHRMISEVQDYAIILLNKEGDIENWNKGAERIKGYKADQVLGKNFRIFYTREDQQRHLPEALLAKATQSGRALHEGWRLRRDGSTFWGSIVITAIHNDHDEIIGFSKVTRDLTERKAAEDALEEKNKELERMNQELSTFAYVSSHDLQEPLRKIQTFTTRILETEGGNFSEKGLDYFTRIRSAASRMRVLIEDLLTYSRANTSERKFVPTDLNTLVDEAASELSEIIETKNAKLEYTALPQINVIPFQFVQLVANLLSNALKFSKIDIAPHITIKADIIAGNQIQNLMADEQKSYHHIAFSDNGIGFQPQYSSRIFEVFQRLHNKSEYEGTGVGLAICKKIVNNHGGIITAEGKVNEGATFHIYLPT